MEHVTIKSEDFDLVGELKPGTRTFMRQGPLEEVGNWHDRLTLHFGPHVSLGGVMMYCPVSRSALHERLDRGGLTVFQYKITERKANLLGTVKTVFRKTYSYVPVSELHSWRKDIEVRAKAKGIDLTESNSARMDEIVRMQNKEDDEMKKAQPAKLEIPLSQYDLEFIQHVAWRMKYDSAGKFIIDVLRPMINGGFSGLSFGRAGLWMASLIEANGGGELPLPKFLEKLRKK